MSNYELLCLQKVSFCVAIRVCIIVTHLYIIYLLYIYVLAGYPASLETLSPGLSPPPSLVPLSPLSYSSLPSTLPPSDYPVSLRLTAFYFEMFAPNPPPPVGWGGVGVTCFGYFFGIIFFYRFSRQFVKFPALLKF